MMRLDGRTDVLRSPTNWVKLRADTEALWLPARASLLAAACVCVRVRVCVSAAPSCGRSFAEAGFLALWRRRRDLQRAGWLAVAS